jgi:hypothetical protein
MLTRNPFRGVFRSAFRAPHEDGFSGEVVVIGDSWASSFDVDTLGVRYAFETDGGYYSALQDNLYDGGTKSFGLPGRDLYGGGANTLQTLATGMVTFGPPVGSTACILVGINDDPAVTFDQY